MKQTYIKDLIVGTEITDYFMVVESSIRTGTNGRAYLDIRLGDKTGDVSAKKWNLSPAEIDTYNEIKTGELVKIIANVKEWNGAKQLDISRIRKTSEEDGLVLSSFVKAAPYPPQEMFDHIYAITEEFKDEELKNLCQMVLNENKEKIMYWPAASKNHHAEYAGLLYHTMRMLDNAKAMYQVYGNILNEDLLYAGVILHDIQKMGEILSDENGMSPGYSFEGQMLGHIISGVKEMEKYCDRLNIGEEKKIMLEHMILSHHYEPEFGSPKKPLFPEAELLHYLDIIDAKMFDMEEALANTEINGFSERVWTLDNRRLYKATDSKIKSE